MSREWKPGDVAMVTIDDGESYRAFRQDASHGSFSDPLWTLERRVDGVFDHYDRKGRVTGVRPLVVIDADDRKQVERLHRAYEQARRTVGPDYIATVQTALRSLVTDPKPEEPQGLGAVVEDDRGRQWIRVDWVNPWCIAKPNRRERHQRPTDDADHASHVKWPEVRAVRVLSEGWRA